MEAVPEGPADVEVQSPGTVVVVSGRVSVVVVDSVTVVSYTVVGSAPSPPPTVKSVVIEKAYPAVT